MIIVHLTKAAQESETLETSLHKGLYTVITPFPASARGIGVKVISKWTQVPKKRPAIVQNYISRPFLINGSKFDLRIYVAVTSCDPLRIYVHKNGLVRFASHKYSKSSKNINNRFIHLTNYSVNKKNENYTSNENHEKCQGHKWTLKTLWKHMEDDLHIDWKPIWKSIKDCIVKTIISIESNINSNIKMYCAQKNSVYELFGFDVLLDSKLKPWVIEVNVSPSLHSNSPLDIEVKSGMIADLFNIVGFQLFLTPDDNSSVPLSQNRRPSLSASSIPNYLTNTDCTYLKSTERQCSLISLNKSTRKIGSRKMASKVVERNVTKPNELEKAQSSDSLPNLQSRDSPLNCKDGSRSILAKQKKVSVSSNSSIDNIGQSNQDIIDPSLCQKSGYYNRTLTPNEKLKHTFYIQKDICENQVILSTITDKLTIDDARILIESLDEFNRAGDFELTFPTGGVETDNYMSFIYNNSGCRYYNLLLHQFLKKYHTNDNSYTNTSELIYKFIRPEGVKVLDKYASNVSSNETSSSIWTNPSFKDQSRNKPTFRSSSAGNLSISK